MIKHWISGETETALASRCSQGKDSGNKSLIRQVNVSLDPAWSISALRFRLNGHGPRRDAIRPRGRPCVVALVTFLAPRPWPLASTLLSSLSSFPFFFFFVPRACVLQFASARVPFSQEIMRHSMDYGSG